MNMNINDIIYPILNLIIVAVLSYLGTMAVKFVPVALATMRSNLSQSQYDLVKTVGIEIWNKIEEDYRLGDLVTSKGKLFERMLVARFPEITAEEVNLVNKSIAGEVNKDKPIIAAKIQEVESVPLSITPVIKYFAPDGSELVPAPTIELQ